jgi:hypothetical protein
MARLLSRSGGAGGERFSADCRFAGRLGFRFLPSRPLSPNSPCRGIERPPRPGVARCSETEVSLRGAGVPLRRVAGRSNGGGGGGNMLSISRLRRNEGFLAVFGGTPMPLGIPPPARCRYGVSTVLLRYCYGIAPMLMPSTWEQYRGDTVEIPCLHRACWLGGMLGVARGSSILRKALATAPLAGNRPGLFIFTTVSLAQPAGAGQQRVFIGGGARKGRIHAPKLEKPAGKRSKKALTPEFTMG